MIVKEKVTYTRRRVKRPTRSKAVTFRAFPEQVDRWFAAAERAEMSFAAWLARSLDAAAKKENT